MSEEQIDETGTEAEDGQVGGKKKLIIIVVGLLLALGAAAGLYFSGMFGGKHEEATAEHAEEAGHEEASDEGGHGEHAGKPGAPVFYDLPEFLVNLNTNGKQVSFLKVKMSVELEKQEDVAKLENYMPRVTDGVNTYLRELRASDLSGSAGTARLKEEVLLRLNKSLDGVKVRNVYIKSILVQ